MFLSRKETLKPVTLTCPMTHYSFKSSGKLYYIISVTSILLEVLLKLKQVFIKP